MEAALRAELTQLLRELREGDRSAFRPVFEALWPVLLAFTKRLGPNPADTAKRSLMACRPDSSNAQVWPST